MQPNSELDHNYITYKVSKNFPRYSKHPSNRVGFKLPLSIE